MTKLGSCMKFEVDVLGSCPYGLCGRKATLKTKKNVSLIVRAEGKT